MWMCVCIVSLFCVLGFLFFLLSLFPQHYLGNLSLERIYSALTHAMHTWHFVNRYTHQHTQTSTELNNRNRKCNCNTTAVTHTSQLLWRLLNHLNVCRREACSWCNVFIRMSWNRMEHNLTFYIHTSYVWKCASQTVFRTWDIRTRMNCKFSIVFFFFLILYIEIKT